MAEHEKTGPSFRIAGALHALAAPSNRGLLMDLSVFALNLSAMIYLSGWFLETIRRVDSNDPAAHWVLFALAAALFVLAPIGATLKRWHHHQAAARSEDILDDAGGCLFNPIVYFCLTVLIFATVNAFLIQEIYGRKEPNGGVFTASILAGIALMILHTALVYRYFSKPKNPPRSAFLRGPASAFFGDACLFANMFLFQILWNLLGSANWPRPSGVGDFAFRLALLSFLALLLYFPPRMFYLAEDIGKRRTWAMIFLANSPILYRVLIGSDTGVHW